MVRSSAQFLQLLSVLALSSSGVQADNHDEVAYIYFDNITYLANSSNVFKIAWQPLEKAFQAPNQSDRAVWEGFDWTKPYPGSPLAGFTTHLRIADDIPVGLPDDYVPLFPTEDSKVVTNVASLTFAVPPSLVGPEGLRKEMDPSWEICQHYYVSSVPDASHGVQHDCAFLPEQCRTDLISGVVDKWGEYYEELGAMCGDIAFGSIPSSCQDALGYITSDVLSYNHSLFDKPENAKYMTNDEVDRSDWMIGTGYNNPNDAEEHFAASTRTYIVATVFGHSSDLSDVAKPSARLACLRGKDGRLDEIVASTAPAASTPGESSISANPSTASPSNSSDSTSPVAASTTTEAASMAGQSASIQSLSLFLSFAVFSYVLL